MWQRLGIVVVGFTAALSASALNFDRHFGGGKAVPVYLHEHRPASIDHALVTRDGNSFFVSLEGKDHGQVLDVQKFHIDGSADDSFDFDQQLAKENGWVVNYQRVAQAADGGLYVARELARPHEGDSRTKIYKVDPQGHWDRAFADHGVLDLAFVANLWREAFVTDAQGRLWLAGGDHSFARAKVLRFLPNGQPDAQFAQNGVLSLSYLASFGLATFVDEQARLLVMSQGGSNVGVLRYLSNGQPDAQFAGGGAIWFPDVAGSFPTPYDIRSTAQGIWGFHHLDVRNANNQQQAPLFRAFKLDANGARVASFGDQGVASAEGPGGNVTGVVLPLNDGRFVLSSWTSVGSRTALYSADGHYINAIDLGYYGSASLVPQDQSVLLGVNYGDTAYVYKLLTTE